MGLVMGEQVGSWGGGGTPSAMGLRLKRAFEEKLLIIQACGDAGAIQACRASRRFSMKEGRAAQEQEKERGVAPSEPGI